MSKCWYCNKEITTGNNPEHLGICDKCYNEMFKCGNEFIRNMVNKIADLEAKLAESEKRLVNCVDFNTWQKTAKENNELKQQLAEKEAEIEEFKNRERKIFSLSLYTEFENKLKQANQDKISFAVEKLSDVRSFICDATEIKEPDYTKVCNYIDNQIKQLKEK